MLGSKSKTVKCDLRKLVIEGNVDGRVERLGKFRATKLLRAEIESERTTAITFDFRCNWRGLTEQTVADGLGDQPATEEIRSVA